MFAIREVVQELLGNACSSVFVIGVGAFLIDSSTFSVVGCTPSLSMHQELHFCCSKHTFLFLLPEPCLRLNTACSLLACSSGDFPVMRMSSKYGCTPGIPASRVSMNLWKIANVVDTPKCSLVGLKSLLCLIIWNQLLVSLLEI